MSDETERDHRYNTDAPVSHRVAAKILGNADRAHAERDKTVAILRRLVDLDDRFANSTDPDNVPLAEMWTSEIEKARALLAKAEGR